MTKFSALSAKEFWNEDRVAGRVARKCPIVVLVEVDDGSWCELDADSPEHARTLADNWVDVHNARGASCWIVLTGGKLPRAAFYFVTEAYDVEDETPIRYLNVIRNTEVRM